MRGLAVVLMIQCHTFNAFARPDAHGTGAYILSQFIGGMASPLFLFMAGMTLAFQMESLERREPSALRRWRFALGRAAYILGIAFAFRFSNFVASIPHADPREIIKVDILNCMGVSLAVLSVAAVLDGKGRARFAAAAGLAVAAAAPLMVDLPWDHAPALLKEYLVPLPGLGHFPFFPSASYAAFGIAAGAMVKRTAENRFDRLMQWCVLAGFPLIFTAQYFANLPFSIYRRTNFWTDSPAHTLINTGVLLLIMPAAYLWTEYIAAPRWSWMQCLGKNSLMVYWVHVMLVYGDGVSKRIKGNLTIPQTVVAGIAVTLLMLAMSAAWLWWKKRRREAQAWKIRANETAAVSSR
jgi:uncharacterized membrane protein